jgi:hypothetical protein
VNHHIHLRVSVRTERNDLSDVVAAILPAFVDMNSSINAVDGLTADIAIDVDGVPVDDDGEVRGSG